MSDRGELMERHRVARARRDAAALGSDEFRQAAEEVARIEIEIARREEPPPSTTEAEAATTTGPTPDRAAPPHPSRTERRQQ